MTPRPLLLAILLLASHASFAQVYKWVDQNGVVNYTSEPPPKGKQSSVITADSPKVTVVPALSVPAATASDAAKAKPAAPADDPTSPAGLQKRVEELEKRLRESEAKDSNAVASDRQAAVERCQANRGTDCEANPYQNAASSPVIVLPVPVHQRSDRRDRRSDSNRSTGRLTRDPSMDNDSSNK